METVERKPLRCRKCGESFRRAAILAMLSDLGARVYPSPETCPRDGEHEFTEGGE